jgi:hypothetical protein
MCPISFSNPHGDQDIKPKAKLAEQNSSTPGCPRYVARERLNGGDEAETCESPEPCLRRPCRSPFQAIFHRNLPNPEQIEQKITIRHANWGAHPPRLPLRQTLNIYQSGCNVDRNRTMAPSPFPAQKFHVPYFPSQILTVTRTSETSIKIGGTKIIETSLAPCYVERE